MTNPNLTRRAALAGGAMAAVAGVARPARAQAAAKTFVLVAGAAGGGWQWRRVADLLEKQGCKVFAPTLTGLGERSHLLTKDVGLDTHITDIVNVVRWESLEGICLVAHSYAGWPCGAALDRIGDKVASVVWLDAFKPEDGRALIDLVAASARQTYDDAAAKGELGMPLPPRLSTASVNPRDEAFLRAKLTPHPIATYIAGAPLRRRPRKDRQEDLRPPAGLRQSGVRQGLRRLQGRQVVVDRRTRRLRPLRHVRRAGAADGAAASARRERRRGGSTSASRLATASAAARWRWARVAAAAASPSPSTIALAIARCSRTEARITSTVSASPTWAMISVRRRRADSSCNCLLPARFSTRGVEGGVLVEIGLHAARRVGEDHRDRLDEARARRLVRRLRGEAGGERLHLDPDLEQFADVARRQPPNNRAAVRRVLDQPFGGETPQRFAHRPAAHRKALGQRALDQPFARPQPMGEDVAAQAVDDMGDRRAVRRRVLPVAAPRRSSRRRLVHVLPMRLRSRNAVTMPSNGAAEKSAARATGLTRAAS